MLINSLGCWTFISCYSRKGGLIKNRVHVHAGMLRVCENVTVYMSLCVCVRVSVCVCAASFVTICERVCVPRTRSDEKLSQRLLRPFLIQQYSVSTNRN